MIRAFKDTGWSKRNIPRIDWPDDIIGKAMISGELDQCSGSNASKASPALLSVHAAMPALMRTMIPSMAGGLISGSTLSGMLHQYCNHVQSPGVPNYHGSCQVLSVHQSRQASMAIPASCARRTLLETNALKRAQAMFKTADSYVCGTISPQS